MTNVSKRGNKKHTVFFLRCRALDRDCLMAMCSSAPLPPSLPSPSVLLSGRVVHPGRGVQTVERGKTSGPSLCRYNSIRLSPDHDRPLCLHRPSTTTDTFSPSKGWQCQSFAIDWPCDLSVSDWLIKITATCIRKDLRLRQSACWLLTPRWGLN